MTALLVRLATVAVAAGLNAGRPSAHPTVGIGLEGLAVLQRTTAGAAPPPVPAVAPGQLASLPAATTTATLPAAPRDTTQGADTDGTVVHNTQPLPVFTAPGDTPFAQLPTTQVGSDTWLPVITAQPGWIQVLLPSRPNGSTGWLDASRLQQAHTPYLIRVHLASRTLQLVHAGRAGATWPAGIGQPGTPTPAGRTFLLASITDQHQNYSPIILPLGTHSSTLDSFGGGPGTVAIHTWPTPDTFGTPSSHGCIRVPQAQRSRARPPTPAHSPIRPRQTTIHLSTLDSRGNPMRARDLTITTSIAAVALSVSGMAATPAGHRDIVSIVVHSVSPLAVPAPSVDTIYAVPLKPTSAAI